MVSKRTLLLSVAVALVMAVPAVAWAFNPPVIAEIPAPDSPELPGDKAEWMSEMHDHMWGDGTHFDGLSGDTAEWMSEMHDHMWRDGTHLGGLSGDTAEWMNEMHDHMWRDGTDPSETGGWMRSMRGGMWGGR